MDDIKENVIEFYTNQRTATVTFNQGRYVSRIKKLAKERPDECQLVALNSDGTITAHVPTRWVKISPPKQISDEQRERMRLMGKENLVRN